MQGDLAGALKSYQAGLEIRRRLAERDPDNAWWKCELSISHGLISDVLCEQGDWAGALKIHQANLEIRRWLFERDPGHAEWQLELLLSHLNMGAVHEVLGDLDGMLQSCQAGLEVARRIAEREPDNPVGQVGLVALGAALSQLETPALSRAERRALLECALAVLERLQERGELPPDQQTLPDLLRQKLKEMTP
ncbi:hypothetical protein X805_39850 [Sphaerotilus natans subsp. natans DSM 6575]|uniref:Tetratricopeptide repeat protein n=1 Tax=Sphaerotilus natans subsp. natans DSM 6575 TaxID=1286631 RepID=A0A059KG44_9BURK|nr:hypothetical protein [Sphaerotilus natans]KDB50426.1 hypothetical protein X805_39850 [Sphaerotilus natans subsp. natans DSM 6575]SIR81876.1 hypothetical protein SAMN05421778_11810 [Sphaerotilus natans]